MSGVLDERRVQHVRELCQQLDRRAEFLGLLLLLALRLRRTGGALGSRLVASDTFVDFFPNRNIFRTEIRRLPKKDNKYES